MKKRSAKKTSRRGKKKVYDVDVVTSNDEISPYAKSVLRVFRKGVKGALQEFGEKNIAVLVRYKNADVRGVPSRETGRVVTEERVRNRRVGNRPRS